MSEAKYWVGFSLIPGIGRVRLGRLISYFGNLQIAWDAAPQELKAAGLDKRSLHETVSRRPTIDLDAEMEKLERHQIRVITHSDAAFPPRLKEIHDAPPILYVKGNLTADDEWALAVVGTRRASAYGREVTRRLVGELARTRITIVSGLARGIDTIAHRTALAENSRTIAVLACGLDTIYPSENKELAEEIAQNGALVTDYPLGSKPKAENFPQRNRIMSGLSLGVLVVESMEKGGSLITANMALQQDREVFAVPGSILSPTSRGTNALIRAGAKAVLGIDDIMEELNISALPQQLSFETPSETILPNKDETLILQHLSTGPLHIDELIRRSSMSISTVSSTLTIMELRGMVEHLGNMNYGVGQRAGINR